MQYERAIELIEKDKSADDLDTHYQNIEILLEFLHSNNYPKLAAAFNEADKKLKI